MIYLKIFLIGLFISTTAIAQNKIITSDIALYRIEEKVTFLSAYKTFRKQLNIFRCFENKVLLLPALELDKANLKTLPSVKKVKSFDEESKKFLKKLILLEKALIHIKKQGRHYDKKFLKYFERSKCLNSPYKTWSKQMKYLVTVELYFQERFKKGPSHIPLTTFDPQTWENVRFYLLSLDKKFKHDVFF